MLGYLILLYLFIGLICTFHSMYLDRHNLEYYELSEAVLIVLLWPCCIVNYIADNFNYKGIKNPFHHSK